MSICRYRETEDMGVEHEGRNSQRENGLNRDIQCWYIEGVEEYLRSNVSIRTGVQRCFSE